MDQRTVLRLATSVPDRDGFPLVDDLHARFAALAAAHPDRVTVTRIGTSRLGEPLHSYRIGSGSHAAVVVGGVHPNEPIGSWTALHLAETMATDTATADALDTTWHVVPTIDPDGMRLNEAWFHDPHDRVRYARGFYRPAPDSQVEWTFPNSHGSVYFDQVLPETLAFMRLIDDTEPELLVSLHNGEMGGVYYYLSEDLPDVIDTLHAVPAALGLPLDTGEPESPYLRAFAPAVFAMEGVEAAYDYLEGLGIDPGEHIHGASSAAWAMRHGALCLVAELPYWSHPDADDQTPTSEPYAHLLRRCADALGASGAELQEVLDAATPMLTIETPFLEGSRAFIPMIGGMTDTDRARADREPAERMATVAERFGCEDLVRCFRLRYGGMLLRALEAETVAGTAPAPLRRLRDRLAERYAVWQADEATGAEPIPISKLVGVQYGAILACAAHVADPTRASRPQLVTTGRTGGA
ncbi:MULTISPECIES: M14 family zinc carboxypeptidase [unclassified Curtobacterium]|uniref:M14 family zinc carboxypeptidase n=1 Tax=unclassified Curtobacterium TaxID=257496 RepID=UPI0008DCFA7B|nr:MULTISPECIES: M14 family zinc carboxypeptidase [unclassified Curtobacterium]OIH96914.1 peptidase M14 [Curtobacterium sp. MCBA15_003]OII09411.1 peptidase M14 [Curtobacterium sp. MCBA15_009]OII31101.1 peptidase M14 [Curtobacterium sp. MMLR14_006]